VSEADSFLLLGDGERLDVTAIKEGLGSEFDFGDIDLLTLSACNTAYLNKGAGGQELESFAAVTQEQGARAVLASMWPILDSSTALFMRRFYELSVVGGLPRPDALAQAMRDFIEGKIDPADLGTVSRGSTDVAEAPAANGAFSGYTHPLHWAPFILLEGL
jgi:CHAT domain-containing protein